MKIPPFHLLLAILLVNPAILPAAEPANPNANPKARAILNYFHELSVRKEGRRVLSGQFSDFGNGANLRIMQRIHDNTGHWPALIGVDYADFGRGSLTYKVPNKVAIDYWKQGGLVTVMAHMFNPANPKGGGLRDKGVNLDELLQPGTETHQRWMKELDLIAEGLQELKDAGVVVLWRPFHEMNGGWFWWGAKDPEKFIQVWHHMFDYFTGTKQLDNLLWVYGPNHGSGTAKYYAGDHQVDLVGLDAYTDFIDREHIKGFDEIVALPKPFGFTEYGPHGSQNPPGNYDYRRFIDGLLRDFSQTCFFMCWNAKWSLATNQNTKELLSHPSLVNRDALPAGLVATATQSPASGATSFPVPLPRAHSHNDYQHARPLFDALDHGFCSIEADVFLIDGRLLVAHDRDKTSPERTLERLYLEPLRERAKANRGRIYPGGPVCWLFIDLKTEAGATYAALHALLKEYQDLVTRIDGDRVTTNALTVIITGNRPRETIASQSPRFAAVDGLAADLDSAASPLLVPVISEKWGEFFGWTATGSIPETELAQLKEMVRKTHAGGRQLRLWGAPDNSAAWRVLFDAGVDLINTDNHDGLRDFLLPPR